METLWCEVPRMRVEPPHRGTDIAAHNIGSLSPAPHSNSGHLDSFQQTCFTHYFGFQNRGWAKGWEGSGTSRLSTRLTRGVDPSLQVMTVQCTDTAH